MKQIFSPTFLVICFFISSNINAQVIKKKADKSHVVKTQKLESTLPKYKLIKIEPNKISKSINSKLTKGLVRNKYKVKKLPKIQKDINIKYLKGKDDE
tara:strand:+ start:1368 stop:1661 length:294 start_codon:yes stop_codon:yes gene_type:complete